MLNESEHADLIDYDHDDEELDEDEGHAPPAGRYAAMQQQYGGPTDFAFQSRSYDDEDAALQAALKASMDELPEGFVLPELKPIEPPSIMRPTPPAPAPAASDPETKAESKVDDEEEDEEDVIEEDDDDEPAQSLSPGKSSCSRLIADAEQKRSALRVSRVSSNERSTRAYRESSLQPFVNTSSCSMSEDGICEEQYLRTRADGWCLSAGRVHFRTCP